jgi:hypothetical protein
MRYGPIGLGEAIDYDGGKDDRREGRGKEGLAGNFEFEVISQTKTLPWTLML